jgi:predicted RNA polymerase sigma factor
MTDSFSGFEAWYSDSHPRVLAVLTVVSGDADAASDATDEAFARARARARALARWHRVGAMNSATGWSSGAAIAARRRQGAGSR